MIPVGSSQVASIQVGHRFIGLKWTALGAPKWDWSAPALAIGPSPVELNRWSWPSFQNAGLLESTCPGMSIVFGAGRTTACWANTAAQRENIPATREKGLKPSRRRPDTARYITRRISLYGPILTSGAVPISL